MRTEIKIVFFSLSVLVCLGFSNGDKNICIKTNKQIAIIGEEIQVVNCGDKAPGFLNIGIDWGDGSAITKGQEGRHKYQKEGKYKIQLMLDEKPINERFENAKNTELLMEIVKKSK